MVYPTDTDFPGALDSLQDRTDDIDIIWADDFDFQDKQIRKIQEFLGETGKLIGENIAGAGPAGLVSPVADGGTAIKLAARNNFTSGTVLSVEDNFDVAPQQLARINYAGLLWTLGGADLSDSEFLQIPEGTSLPGGLGTDDKGRLFYYSGVGIPGLYAWTGTEWSIQGGAWEGYIDAASDYSFTQASTPIEEVPGQFVFDGSKVATGMKATFRAIMTPTFTTGGTAECRVYDLGAPGSPEAPRLVSTLSWSASGVDYKSKDLTIVSATPGTDEILDSARMYELTIYMNGTTGDTTYLGSAGMNVEWV